MKIAYTLGLAATAALALAACNAEDGAEEGASIESTAEEVAVDVPDVEVTTEGAPDESGDSVSISADGVSADINGGGTSVQANVGEDPSLTVKTN